MRDQIDFLTENDRPFGGTTAAVLVSSVLFDTAERVPHLDTIATAARREGAALLIDAYHHLNVVPFDIRELGLDEAGDGP